MPGEYTPVKLDDIPPAIKGTYKSMGGYMYKRGAFVWSSFKERCLLRLTKRNQKIARNTLALSRLYPISHCIACLMLRARYSLLPQLLCAGARRFEVLRGGRPRG